ncbi:MAG: SufE family protein [Pseudomonadota bacterium]
MAREAFEEIVETFEFLDEWEDRYAHVIDLGKAMPPMAETLKSALTKVDGCVSQVWIAPEVDEDADGKRLSFIGDSDAMIVRGLIAILQALISGERTAEIVKIDVIGELGRLGLDQHLSAQRSNGLKAMVVRLRELAQAAETA